MSDPAGKPEVDDVLAAIRQMSAADELRWTREPPAAPDRLVLSSEQRVAPERKAPAPLRLEPSARRGAERPGTAKPEPDAAAERQADRESRPAGGAAPLILGEREAARTGGLGELDEARLREMVGEMVRQELQGALGERITRNLRKLVRREILRAMSARETD